MTGNDSGTKPGPCPFCGRDDGTVERVGGACACLQVRYLPEHCGGGLMRERWLCPSCGAEFRRQPAAPNPADTPAAPADLREAVATIVAGPRYGAVDAILALVVDALDERPALHDEEGLREVVAHHIGCLPGQWQVDAIMAAVRERTEAIARPALRDEEGLRALVERSLIDVADYQSEAEVPGMVDAIMAAVRERWVR